MIVVTTPTGQIGSQVVERLINEGEAIRVIARDPGKLPPHVRTKADVVRGAMESDEVWLRALDGAESLFLVVPPSFTTNNVREYYLRLAQPACRALQHHGVKRVVAVSALGRGLPMDGGLVSDSFAKDEAIENTGVDFRALWCPGFMENMLRDIPSLRQQGTFFSPSSPDVKLPRAATRDIAAVGTRLLLDRAWSGQEGVPVLGPEDLSLNQMAAILSEVLGKEIRYVQIPPDAFKARLIQFGASEHVAQRMVDMLVAKDDGLDIGYARTDENANPTSFRQWCEEMLRPAFQRA